MRMTSTQLRILRQCALALMVGGILLLPIAAKANDDSRSLVRTPEPQQVSLVVGKSTVVDTPVAIKRASLADPQVADAIVLSPRQIYVTGKGYGMTNLTLWGKDDQIIAVFDLDVGVDLVRLNVTISGTVSSEGRLHQVLAVAEAYAPKKVLNFVKIYPEPIGDPAPDVRTVTVEVIKGTSVGSVKF
jgi:pilus assembly protein CpaC